MKILTVYAHPNPKSFCQAVLQQFSEGLKAAGHSNEVVDLYAIRLEHQTMAAVFIRYQLRIGDFFGDVRRILGRDKDVIGSGDDQGEISDLVQAVTASAHFIARLNVVY